MVSDEMSKARQQTVVGEGLAVGLLSLGVDAVTSDKQAVEIAFRRAWRDWPHHVRFPQVRAELGRENIVRVLRDSTGRRGPVLADWQFEGAECVPRLRVDWSVAEAGDAVAEESGVPFEQWVELARAFVAELRDDEVHRRQ